MKTTLTCHLVAYKHTLENVFRKLADPAETRTPEEIVKDSFDGFGLTLSESSRSDDSWICLAEKPITFTLPSYDDYLERELAYLDEAEEKERKAAKERIKAIQTRRGQLLGLTYQPAETPLQPSASEDDIPF